MVSCTQLYQLSECYFADYPIIRIFCGIVIYNNQLFLIQFILCIGVDPGGSKGSMESPLLANTHLISY